MTILDSDLDTLKLCECARCGRFLMGESMIEIWDSLPTSTRNKWKRGYQFVAGYETVYLDFTEPHRRPICRGCL